MCGEDKPKCAVACGACRSKEMGYVLKGAGYRFLGSEMQAVYNHIMSNLGLAPGRGALTAAYEKNPATINEIVRKYTEDYMLVK